MIHAAGILILCGDTALFLRRGNGADHPNEWACPGGRMEGDETEQEAAIRETLEEAGYDVSPALLKPWTRTLARAETPLEQATEAVPADPAQTPAPSEDVDFTTFLCRVDEQFLPILCDEHDGFCWAPITAPPQPLHPGVQLALDRFNMDELGVARAMSLGNLTSPQRYENVWLFAIRITGTGISYRHNRKEFVWRDPAVYLNDDFLARCNGLPVIWEHPEKSLLNSKEFDERKIGTVFLPYLRADKGDEVWAIAKIYDDDAAKDMSENIMSTSPAVNFADPTENDRIKLEDGKIMLIEGKPSLLDHIAICPAGVWDKGGEPSGVESIMADESLPVINKCQARGLDPARFDLLRAHVGALSLKAQLRANH